MTIKHDILAQPSVAGHYNIQYPHHDAAPITVPAGTSLIELSWLSPEGGWKPYAWDQGTGLLIVWIKS